MPGAIVVGIENATASADALRWAAWQSQRTGNPLVVVHAYPPDRSPDPSAQVRTTRESVARAWATRWLRDALSDSGALPFTTRLVVTQDDPADALVRRSRDAAMLVLGQRASTRAGSHSDVTTRCQNQAHCPVVLVPEGTDLEDVDAKQRGATRRPGEAVPA
jgi:nucleotide-binding universal stress UspA family protein